MFYQISDKKRKDAIMSVNEPTNGADSGTMNIAIGPEYKTLLDKIAKRNGDLGRSAMVRVLILQEGNRLGIPLEPLTQPA